MQSPYRLMDHTACLNCDLLVNIVDIKQGESAACPRCHHNIYLDKLPFIEILAFVLTALMLYFPAVLLPLLSMETVGQITEVSLLQSIMLIADGDLIALAVVVFLLVIFFPFVRLSSLLFLLFSLSRERLPLKGSRSGMSITRLLLNTAPWSMLEVYLVGALVTMVKLMGVATINFSMGFYAFIALIFTNALISFNLPHKRIWQSIATVKSSQANFSGSSSQYLNSRSETSKNRQ